MKFIPGGKSIHALIGFPRRQRFLGGTSIKQSVGGQHFARAAVIPPGPSIAKLGPGNLDEVDAKDSVWTTTLPPA